MFWPSCGDTTTNYYHYHYHYYYYYYYYCYCYCYCYCYYYHYVPRPLTTIAGLRVTKMLRSGPQNPMSLTQRLPPPTWTPKVCRIIALYMVLGHYFTYFGGFR